MVVLVFELLDLKKYVNLNSVEKRKKITTSIFPKSPNHKSNGPTGSLKDSIFVTTQTVLPILFTFNTQIAPSYTLKKDPAGTAPGIWQRITDT